MLVRNTQAAGGLPDRWGRDALALNSLNSRQICVMPGMGMRWQEEIIWQADRPRHRCRRVRDRMLPMWCCLLCLLYLGCTRCARRYNHTGEYSVLAHNDSIWASRRSEAAWVDALRQQHPHQVRHVQAMGYAAFCSHLDPQGNPEGVADALLASAAFAPGNQ